MQDYDSLKPEEGIGISEVHAVATSTDTEQGKLSIPTVEFTQEYAKDLNCYQA